MRKTLSASILILTSVLSQADSQKEVSEILEQHFSGIREGNIELLQKSWNTEIGSITEIKNNVLTKQDLQKSFSMWAKEKSPDFSAKIQSINEISESISVAKVSITWKGDHYSDALTLAKGASGWRIISKVYQAPKKTVSRYGL